MRRTGARSYAVPLVVAVTGHRDLVPAEEPQIRERVRECLANLRDDYPGRIIVVMSPLAEGADRLVAEVALALGMPLQVVLPMPREMYAQDFTTSESQARFAALCDAAGEVVELPLTAGNTPASIGKPENRAKQYAHAGVFLCAHCHVLLALWDGKETDQLGGTSQVVRFHHHDVMPGYTSRTTASRLNLTDDESDLVHHIVCSRDRPDGAPADGLMPLDAHWYTTDLAPRAREMPARHRIVFKRTNEFSVEAQQHAARIDAERYSLLNGEQATLLPQGLWDINQAFCAADWLAIRYQKRVLLTQKIAHACALLTGLAYLTYTDFSSTPWFIWLIVLAMLTAVGVNVWARRGAWHRKYLDYRTLAEGLRVQFYWSAAGVTSGSVSKFAHDNFLQMQDTELGWIRNVMRVAGTECDVLPNLDPYGLRFTIDEWIGDHTSGQLGYYRRKTAQRVADHMVTQRTGKLGILATLIALTALLFVGAGLSQDVKTPVVYLMGFALLMVGVRQSYAKSTAESELIKQFDFMHRIFRNARRRIDDAESDAERRRILKVLGDSALEEHAQWILIHREREQQDAVKIG